MCWGTRLSVVPAKDEKGVPMNLRHEAASPCGNVAVRFLIEASNKQRRERGGGEGRSSQQGTIHRKT